VQAQGGDPRREALPRAAVVQPVPAPASGYVHAIATTAVGLAALRLGAGRLRKEDAIDHAVGVVCLAKRGDAVQVGEPLAEVHARDEESAIQAGDEIAACYRLGDRKPERKPIVLDVLS
jgi:thymidine phosphorylase